MSRPDDTLANVEAMAVVTVSERACPKGSPSDNPNSRGVVVKGLCQGLVLSDYVSLVVDGVYVKLFSTTSGAPFVRLWFNGNWFPVMAVI